MKKWLVRAPIVAAVSIAFALALSQIPYVHYKLSGSVAGQQSSVFRHHKEVVLKESNIVDVMQQVPIQLRIHKLEISPTMLTVDLVLQDRLTEQSYVFSDLYELTYYIFQHTENISQVFVRVMEAETNLRSQLHLLVAVGAKKDEYSEGSLQHTKMTNTHKEQYVRTHYRLVETSRWKDLRFH